MSSAKRANQAPPPIRALPQPQAMDPLSEVILAFQQNGRLLQPDHGFPLRLIIPGA